MQVADYLVVASSKKRMELREFEPVIRKCPIDLIDTEQRAFYAYKPDFTVKVNTPTNPSTQIILEPKEEHKFNWYVVAKCGRCGYLYSVFGIEQYRIKNLPQEVKTEDVSFALMCCDVCYNEEYTFRVADIFINLSSGRSIYLCAEHSDEIEKNEKKKGSYEELNKRMEGWAAEKGVPKSILIKGELIILTNRREEALRKIYQEGTHHKGQGVAPSSYSYLLNKGLISERLEGFLIKKPLLAVTDKGREAIENLDRLF